MYVKGLVQLICERIVHLMISMKIDTLLEYTLIKVFGYRDIADSLY